MFCSLCAIAVVSGLGFSRYLGVSDSLSGVWVAGLILLASFLLADLLKNKFKSRYIYVLTALLTYFFVLVPLFVVKFLTDKLILGIEVGSVAFLIGLLIDRKLREKRKGKAVFRFQKVVLPLSALIISSLGLYLLGL